MRKYLSLLGLFLVFLLATGLTWDSRVELQGNYVVGGVVNIAVPLSSADTSIVIYFPARGSGKAVDYPSVTSVVDSTVAADAYPITWLSFQSAVKCTVELFGSDMPGGSVTLLSGEADFSVTPPVRTNPPLKGPIDSVRIGVDSLKAIVPVDFIFVGAK